MIRAIPLKRARRARSGLRRGGFSRRHAACLQPDLQNFCPTRGFSISAPHSPHPIPNPQFGVT